MNASLDTSLGELVYNKDMIMDVPMIENLAIIRDRRHHLINKNLIRNNEK